jgi:hypothetical protein
MGASGWVADAVDDEVESSSFVVDHGTEGVGGTNPMAEDLPVLKGFSLAHRVFLEMPQLPVC